MDRGMLARATDGTDAPTPGYLYVDISKNAASSPMVCSDMALYLTNRLASKNNHNIKYKCLKVIAKVAQSQKLFKRAVAQDASAVARIKEALQFRGPPDPARGDEIYSRVRNAAKEALDAIYSDDASTVESTPMSSYGGGGSYSGAPHSSSVAQSKYQGIGNPMYKDPRLEAQQGIGSMTIGEVASVAGETIVGMIKDPLARNVEVGPPPPPRSSMPGFGSGYSGPPPGASQLAQATGGQWTMASNRGPSAIQPPENFNSERDAAYFKARDGGNQAFDWASAGGAKSGGGGVGGSWASASTTTTPSIQVSSNPSVASQAQQPAYGGGAAASTQPLYGGSVNTGAGGTAASDGSYERNLIMELCPPGGLKAEPPLDKLRKFALAVPSLNPDLVCPALLDCLEEGQPWIIRAKALCVMDTILKSQPSGPYADFFHTCRGEIEPLAQHPRAAISEPAKRVLRQLGLQVSASASGQRVAPTAAAPVPNLLDFDDEPAPAAAPPAAAPPAPSDSLFGGLKTKEPASAAPTSGNLLGETTTPAPAPNGGLFGNMQVKEKTALAAPAPAATDPFAASNAPAPAAPAPAAPAADPFAADSTATDAAPTGSAFGFISGGGGGDTAKESPKPTKESFDPLLSAGVSPNTAKTMMTTLTPAQMQQLAYQQVMMQQQQQMQMYAMQQQQQQMAMRMQQSGGSGMPVMQSNSSASAAFNFMDNPAAQKKDDHTFDFVKDAMKDEGTKK